MKKSLLIINPYLHVGGVEKALISLLRVLPRDKYDIYLMLIKHEGEFIKYIPKDIKVITCPIRHEIIDSKNQDFISVLKKLIKNKQIFKALEWIAVFFFMEKLKNDIPFSKFIASKQANINFHYNYIFNFCGPNNYTSVLAEHILSCDKRYIWIHNEFKAAGKLAAKYKYRYAKYDGIFAVSQNCLNEFVSIIPELSKKTHLLYNITDANFYYEMAKGKKSFTDNYSGIRLLSVGRLNKQKGFDLAIEAAKYLKNRGIDFRWYIIGEGEERNYLQSLIEKYELLENVVLMGVRANPYPFFRDCDIYIQPSRYEGYGLTIAEAKAFYKPIICTNFAGAYDQLKNKFTGIIVECNLKSLTDAIEEMILNSDLRTKLSYNLKSITVNTTAEIKKLESYMISRNPE